ncbi:Methionine--tRNA ligase, cytoplasmic [Eumeta japonica]|uniref:Methionine--tRNA ligase, cytoplasmic n=1 Tax=Eumeta variegata TaxID=151549 RepID=A0A4C1UUS9_EUMVA|nr:Methionine--tRNA ligase, cytoplasmic [Eumeta japonica]
MFTFPELSTGPRQLPLLEVDEELRFFSSNAATQYLFPVINLTENGQCQQLQEWEATRLLPTVHSLISNKTVAGDLKQLLKSQLQELNTLLAKNKYMLGEKLSAADITIWSTVYPLYYNSMFKEEFLNENKNLVRWFEELAAAKAFKEAVTEWGGSSIGPFAPVSVLGLPQVLNISTPVSSPDEGAQEGPTAEEIQQAGDNWLNGLQKLLPPLKEEKKLLPVKGRKNILITSALPYVNNVPHLGNIIGCVLSADIFARYCRICGYNTLYICGTDEYGTATETKALEEKLTPKQICDKYYQIHNDVYRWFNIGFDYFGRTSTPEQTKITQEMFLHLNDNGFISTQNVEQLLCKNCDRFLADRFVEGICPHPGCGYDSARGDQCDKCGKLVTATDLAQPRCKLCGQTPVLATSEQMFLELGQLEPPLRTWFSTAEVGWAPAARSVARAWLRDGLRARCITRDLKWGVPVPLEKYKEKVFYVWFDAPLGYMSITQALTKQYESWWRPNKEYDVKLYQFMAKDNVPFHAIMFPATLMGVNKGHILVDHLYATVILVFTQSRISFLEYLNYEEGKFSKSRGVGVFGTDAQDTGIPADVWRFYLASIRPETSDSSFSWVELGTRNNSELLNNLGNFCHRSLSFCANTFKGVVPEPQLTASDHELIALINREIKSYVNHMEKGRLREALRHVLSISRLGNQHMQAQQPWVLLKGNEEERLRGSTAIGLCCQIATLLCTLLAPYMPDTCLKLATQLNIDREVMRINPENPTFHRYLPPGHVIGKPEPLFAKLEPTRLEELKKKYAGTQAERENRENGESKTENTGGATVAALEAAIAKQAEKVRQLKASTKDKTIWQPEVDQLLKLKAQLAAVAKTAPPAGATANTGDTVQSLERAIAEQGDKVRKLKASTKDKSAWTPEVNVLLDLKKRLAALQVNAK